MPEFAPIHRECHIFQEKRHARFPQQFVGPQTFEEEKILRLQNACTKTLKSLKGKGLTFEPLEARQLLSVSPVVLDNQDTQHYQETGPNWASWSDANAYGQEYRYHAQGDGTNAASWTFDSLEQGKDYQLFATWTADNNRASNSPFTVLDGANSLATVRINEHFSPVDRSFDSHVWQSLGVYHTDTGSLTIRLSDDADAYVIADAVAAIEVEPVTVAPSVVDNADAAYGEQGNGWLGWNEEARMERASVTMPQARDKTPRPGHSRVSIRRNAIKCMQLGRRNPTGRPTRHSPFSTTRPRWQRCESTNSFRRTTPRSMARHGRAWERISFQAAY